MESRMSRTIRLYTSIIFSIIYAFWLSSLPSHLFRDRDNYLVYAGYSGERLELIDGFWILFFEPLFLFINKWLFILYANVDLTIAIFVFFVAFSVSFFCFFRNKIFLFGFLMLIFLFVNSQTLAMQLVTLRQAIGLAFLLLLTPYLDKERHLFILFAVLGLIHNSFFIIALFYFVYLFINSRLSLSYERKLVVFILFGLIFSLSFMLLIKFVQTKQNYDGFEFSSGGGAFMVWSLVLLYILLFKKNVVRDKFSQFLFDISIIGLVIYTTGYFFTPLSGRIIGTFIPFIILLILTRACMRDLVFFLFLACVNLGLYYNKTFEAFLLVPLETFHKSLFNLFL